MSNVQAPQSASEIFGVSVKDGMKMLGNNAKIYLRLLTSFASSPMYDDFVSSVAERDLEKTQVTAHTLKGASGNLHVDSVFEKMRDIESEIKMTGALPSETMLRELAEIQERTLASVNALIAHPEWLDELKG